jgi:hypothetical protein
MANFSCYISIKNESSIKFEHGDEHKSWGAYDTRPKKEIAPNDGTQFRLKDKAGPGGSTGYVTYNAGNGLLRFDYGCPYGSGDNVLKYNNEGTGLEVLYYGANESKYLSDIPENENGIYPHSGHPLSGIFLVRDPLSSGWDVIYSMQFGLLNQQLKSLYDKNIIRHHFENNYAKIKITEAPTVLGGMTNAAGDVVLNIPLKGTIDTGELLPDIGMKKINIDGCAQITVDLRKIHTRINKNTRNEYTISVDLGNGDVFNKVNATGLFEKLPVLEGKVLGVFEGIFLNLMNEYVSILRNPLDFALDITTPIPQDNINVSLTKVINRKKPSKSFLALLIGFDGKKGSNNLSPDTIYDSPDCDSSFILSNSLIMHSIKSAFTSIGKLPEDALELTSAYPSVLTNTRKIEINSVDDVWLKINKGNIKSYFNPEGQLILKVIVKWWNVATLGAEGSTEVDLSIDFSIDDGHINIKIGKHINTNAPAWFYLNPILLLLKSTVENLINKYFVDPLLQSLGDSVLSIPNFQAENIISPSYIRISGKKSK